MRVMKLAAVVGLVVPALSGLASPAQAATPCWDEAITDVDGGGPDIVIGLPSYDVAGKRDAGAIAVFSNVAVSGSSDPKKPTSARIYTARDLGLTTQAGARFGSAVSVWRDAHEFDDPGSCADVWVGAPGQNVGDQAGAGRIYRLHGAPGGFDSVAQTLDENDFPAQTGGAQAGAAFGSAIAVETASVVAVGAPGRDVAGATDAGRVTKYLYTDYDGPADADVVEQGGGADQPESGDRFGSVLSVVPTGDGPIVLVGIPNEDVGTKKDAGMAGMIVPNGASNGGQLFLISQDSPGAAGTAEAGDRYGSSLSMFATFTDHPVVMVAIGVPNEDDGRRRDAGRVSFGVIDLPGTPEDGYPPMRGGDSDVVQGDRWVPGAAEAGDRFGASVLTGEFGSDGGRRHLVVGAPGENLGRRADAGTVTLTRTDETGHPSGRPAVAWSQGSPGVTGSVESGDRFGAALAAVELTSIGDDDDLHWDVVLTTVPGEDVAGHRDVGTAVLGTPGRSASISLVLPTRQSGAGIGMVPMLGG